MRARIIVVTGLVSGVGASVLALCLAQSAVDAGTDCLLIDWVNNAGVSGLWGIPSGTAWQYSPPRVAPGRPTLWTAGCGGMPLALLGSAPEDSLIVIDVRPNTEWSDVATHLADHVLVAVGSNRIGDESEAAIAWLRTGLRRQAALTVVPVPQDRRRRELPAHARRIAAALGCSLSDPLPYVRDVEQTYPLPEVPRRLKPAMAAMLAHSKSAPTRAGQGADAELADARPDSHRPVALERADRPSW